MLAFDWVRQSFGGTIPGLALQWVKPKMKLLKTEFFWFVLRAFRMLWRHEKPFVGVTFVMLERATLSLWPSNLHFKKLRF